MNETHIHTIRELRAALRSRAIERVYIWVPALTTGVPTTKSAVLRTIRERGGDDGHTLDKGAPIARIIHGHSLFVG